VRNGHQSGGPSHGKPWEVSPRSRSHPRAEQLPLDREESCSNVLVGTRRMIGAGQAENR
jgi:hypothetical protein